eukprot:363691-Chlamydomonas_euryale.AAC.1
MGRASGDGERGATERGGTRSADGGANKRRGTRSADGGAKPILPTPHTVPVAITLFLLPSHCSCCHHTGFTGCA